MLKVKYNHPSVPIMGIDIHKIYQCNIEDNKCFLVINNENRDIDLELLKTLFVPIEGIWDDYTRCLEKEIKTVSKGRAEDFIQDDEY